jgi:two-component system, cell cycle response regulator DivK
MNSEMVTLYVEDDAFSRQVMELLFTRKLGYKNISIFEDSADFVKRVEALPSKPDLIMLDIHVMPDNGFKLLSLLRAHASYKNAKIVAVTASVMNEEVVLLKNAGFDGALGKPVDPGFIEQFIEEIMRGQQSWHI